MSIQGWRSFPIRACKNSFTSGSSPTKEAKIEIKMSTILLEKVQVITNGYSMIGMKIMDHVFKENKCTNNCGLSKVNMIQGLLPREPRCFPEIAQKPIKRQAHS